MVFCTRTMPWFVLSHVWSSVSHAQIRDGTLAALEKLSKLGCTVSEAASPQGSKQCWYVFKPILIFPLFKGLLECV